MKTIYSIACICLLLPAGVIAEGYDEPESTEGVKYVEVPFDEADFDLKKKPQLGHHVFEVETGRIKSQLHYVRQYEGHFEGWSTENDKAAGFSPAALEYRAKSIPKLLRPRESNPDKQKSKQELLKGTRAPINGPYYIYDQFKGTNVGALLIKAPLEIGGLSTHVVELDLQQGKYLVKYHIAVVNKKEDQKIYVKLSKMMNGPALIPDPRTVARREKPGSKHPELGLHSHSESMGRHSVTGTLESFQVITEAFVLSEGDEIFKFQIHLEEHERWDRKAQNIQWLEHAYCIVDKVEVIGPVGIPDSAAN